MRKYETVVVIKTSRGEEGLLEEAERIYDVLAEQGARDIVVENWGKHGLAYSIKRERFGFYVCFKYSSEDGGIVSSLQNMLRINENVLRFATYRTDKPVRKFKESLRHASNRMDREALMKDLQTIDVNLSE